MICVSEKLIEFLKQKNLITLAEVLRYTVKQLLQFCTKAHLMKLPTININ